MEVPDGSMMNERSRNKAQISSRDGKNPDGQGMSGSRASEDVMSIDTEFYESPGRDFPRPRQSKAHTDEKAHHTAVATVKYAAARC